MVTWKEDETVLRSSAKSTGRFVSEGRSIYSGLNHKGV